MNEITGATKYMTTKYKKTERGKGAYSTKTGRWVKGKGRKKK